MAYRLYAISPTQFVCGHIGRASSTDRSVLLPHSLHQTECPIGMSCKSRVCYIAFGEESTEESKIIGPLTFVCFQVASMTYLHLGY